MKRFALAAVGAGLVLVAAALAWRWWTAAPAAADSELAAALARAPVANGRLAIADPRTAARWLARHPQAAALPLLAAPAARPALARLQPLLRPLVEGCDGPLVLWWRGDDAAIGCRLRPGSVRALELVAARANVALRADDAFTAVATSPALFAGESGGVPPASGLRLAALAVVGGAQWRAVAGRSSLAVWNGTAADVPAAGDASVLEATDARSLAAALALGGGDTPLPLRCRLGPGGAWAAALPADVLPGFVRDGVRRVAGAGAPPAAWRGMLGEVWVRDAGDALLLASAEDGLAAVAAAPAADEGAVRGADVAAVTARLADTLDGVPLLGREARALRSAADLARGLGSARWRTTAAGTRIVLDW
jgi:hypothetical protein